MRVWCTLAVVALLAGCAGSPATTVEGPTAKATAASVTKAATSAPAPSTSAAPAGTSQTASSAPPPEDPEAPAGPTLRPHVIVAIPDSGINPYHALYFRPELTEPPCTYIQGMPCLDPLSLTVGTGLPYQDAFAQDKALWDGVVKGKWYWIPQTVFVAVSGECDGVCILDDTDMHGTGTTSSVMTENPDALLAFKEGDGDVKPFVDAGIPVDIFSVSWGYISFYPLWPGFSDIPSFYVKSNGNDPRPGAADGWSGLPQIVSVGGAYAASRSETPQAAKNPEVVSYYCRPTAQTRSVDSMRPEYCGTSFAAPTVAGGLSKVILGLRQKSGYLGSLSGGMVDPILGISAGELRDAMNRTAAYAPVSKFADNYLGIPLNPAAPYAQWGWGFYDGTVADATLEFLLGKQVPEKGADVRAYMEAQHAAKDAMHPFS